MYDEIHALSEIESYADNRSWRYGQLLNWPDPIWPIWHYGIGLSDSHIFDTGGCWRAFEKGDARRVIGVDHLLFPPQTIVNRLRIAVTCFKSWDYHLIGWNCEHLARLVATGNAISYEVRSKLICGDGINYDANHLLSKSLEDRAFE